MRQIYRIYELKDIVTNIFTSKQLLSDSDPKDFPHFLVELLYTIVGKYNVFDIFFPEDDNWKKWILEVTSSLPDVENSKMNLEALNIFFDAWALVPDWRFGQFISNTLTVSAQNSEEEFIGQYSRFIENMKA